jgi:hypothetical protein
MLRNSDDARLGPRLPLDIAVYPPPPRARLSAPRVVCTDFAPHVLRALLLFLTKSRLGWLINYTLTV